MLYYAVQMPPPAIPDSAKKRSSFVAFSCRLNTLHYRLTGTGEFHENHFYLPEMQRNRPCFKMQAVQEKLHPLRWQRKDSNRDR
jgi:hypothetical protein